MDRVNRLNIPITKSVLKKFYVEFDDNGVGTVYATIGLMTEGGRAIAEHTAWGGGYHKDFELTEQLKHMLLGIGMVLHGLTERHMSGLDGLLAAPASPAADDKEDYVPPF